MTVEIEHVDDESDIAFAERWSNAIEASGHDWGPDIETALFVAVSEVRRLREQYATAAAARDQIGDLYVEACDKLMRVGAALSTHRGYTLADKIEEIVRGEP